MSDSRLKINPNHIIPVDPGQRFPIYTHLIKGGSYSGDGDWGPYDKEQIEIFKDSALVEGIDPEDMDTKLTVSDWAKIQRHVDALGVIKLPYPRMWVEFEYIIDPSEYAEGRQKTVPGTSHGAAFLWETPMGNIQMTVYVRLQTGHIINMHVGLDIALKDSGEVQEVRFGVASKHLEDKLKDLVEIQALWSVGYPVLYAIGLMNCKNVTVESRTQQSRSSNKENRKKVPKLEYRTILLPNAKNSKKASQGGTHSTAGIHKVRGHFKTYGPEAPLFGKHVGKYWWPWSIRGDANQGVIVSDYKVKK